MSALPVAPPEPTSPPARSRRQLRLVPRPRARMSRVAFVSMLCAIVGIGMVGLLLLNTALQNQAFEATQLRRQVAEISYTQGELEQLVIESGSARELSRKATELGLRPNRDIAFVALPTGLVEGEPKASDGLYLPSALTKTPEEVARDKAARITRQAEERRTQEQQVLDRNRKRIIDARTKELEERQRAAEAAAAAAAAAAQPAGDPQRQPAQNQPKPEGH